MKFSKNELEKIISKGENLEVEFKEKITSDNNISKELVAFSNTNGGLLIIGVTDEGKIKGIKDLKNTEQRIVNICTNNCIPTVTPKTQTEQIEGKNLFFSFSKQSKGFSHDKFQNCIYPQEFSFGKTRSNRINKFSQILI